MYQQVSAKQMQSRTQCAPPQQLNNSSGAPLLVSGGGTAEIRGEGGAIDYPAAYKPVNYVNAVCFGLQQLNSVVWINNRELDQAFQPSLTAVLSLLILYLSIPPRFRQIFSSSESLRPL